MNCLIRGSFYGMAIKPEDGAVLQHSIFSYDYLDSENVTRVEFKRVLFELLTEDDLLEMDQSILDEDEEEEEAAVREREEQEEKELEE